MYANLTSKIQSTLTTKLDIEELRVRTPPIGKGSFGVVYTGRFRGMDVAIKILKFQQVVTKEMVKDFEKEAHMLETLRHPCIIGFVGAVHTAGQLTLVTEYCPYGSLASVLKKKGQLTPSLKLKVLLDAAHGMDYLHKCDIMHRDLKPDNILIVSMAPRSSVVGKISDFGTTRDANKEAMKMELGMTKGIGTPIFQAPEIIDDKPYEKPADVYSFGIMMACVALDKEDPFPETTEMSSPWAFAKAVLGGARPLVEVDEKQLLTQQLIDEMKSCWSGNPAARPTFAHVAQVLNVDFKKALAADPSVHRK